MKKLNFDLMKKLNFDLMKKWNFDLMKFDLLTPTQISTSSYQIRLFRLSGLGKPKSHGELDEET
jgi:hypothetical protein